MSYIDFEEVKAANPIGEVVERLGLDLKKSGKQFRGKCPSGEGGARALVITPDKGVWYSFGLKRGGDVLALVQLVNDCSLKEAAQFLLEGTVPLEKAKKSSPKRGSERGFAPLDYLQPEHDAVDAVGFPVEVAEIIGIGFAPRGILRGQVAVPIRTDDGTLVGYIGIEEAVLPPKWNL